jgi:hypothetical protein
MLNGLLQARVANDRELRKYPCLVWLYLQFSGQLREKHGEGGCARRGDELGCLPRQVGGMRKLVEM